MANMTAFSLRVLAVRVQLQKGSIDATGLDGLVAELDLLLQAMNAEIGRLSNSRQSA